jgi:L,D-peptidoglycan transpeptidase YkuD (ErfK/YbiS/YcfS/YnhG family)
MKFLPKPFLLPFFLTIFLSNSLYGQELNVNVKKAFQIVEKNGTVLDGVGQLLVVFNDPSENSSAILVAMEKSGSGWKTKSDPIRVDIGRNGFAAPGAKRESDGKSPSGLFRMGRLFCYEKSPNTRMPYIQTTNEDKWIDDRYSKDYNRHVRGETHAKSYENLKIHSDAYKYCMVIEYNTHPVVKGMGSAIFFHLFEEIPGPTSGCVALSETDMKWVLAWMNPKLKPSIIMGNEKVLASGLTR